MERSEIQWGLTRIPFAIQRSARRKTVALTVDASGELTVTAPSPLPLDRIHAVVRKKATWIVERLKRRSDRPPPTSSREFVTGESVLYLGRQYRLKVTRGADSEASLKGRWLLVQARGRDSSLVRKAVAAWLREHAELSLPERLAALCKRHDVEKPVMAVSEQKARWGSCNARGTLRINWRIIQAPIALIEYVLLHELTHLTHPTHDRAFWAALGRKMPDYESRRDCLRELGPRLLW